MALELQDQLDTLRQLLDARDYRGLRAAFTGMNAVDLAQFIQSLSTRQALLAFRTLPKEDEMDVFAELDGDAQRHIIEALSDDDLVEIIEELMVDDVVDMLDEIPAKLVKRIKRLLPAASPETRELINRFLLYPEHSAGRLMTAEFTDLKKDMTVGDAIKRIRRIGEDKETIYTCYVIDETRHLEGVVTVKDLLLADDGSRVGELLEADLISISTTADQEQAAALIAKYGLISLPVVDAENRLVGIITVDDAVDIMQEETTEDFEIMAAMSPSEKPYLRSSTFTLARNRLLWLLLLMVSGMLTGAILGRYEAAFSSIPLLVTFIPMLTGTGGNAGSQSSTMIIRGMAVDEIRPRDAGAVLWKELRVSLVVALPLALVNFARIAIFYKNSALVGFVVSAAMVCTVVLANTIGGLLPIVAKLLHIDPAIMAAPLITTIVDAVSLIIYFSIAIALLPI